MWVNIKLHIACFILLLSVQLKAQLSADKLEQFLNSPSLSSNDLQYKNEVKEFYTANGFHSCWLASDSSSQLPILSKYIKQSYSLGLWQDDYQPALFNAYNTSLLSVYNEQDSLLAEIKFTDAAIHFLHDVLVGNQPEYLSYNGLNYTASCNDIPRLLTTYIAAGRFSFLLNEVELKDAEYRTVKNKLNSFQQRIASADFKDAVVTSSKINSSNQPLLKRLYQLGLIDTDTAKLNEPAMKAAVKEAQNLFDLLNDGVLRSTIIEALNVPLATRVAVLQNTLNSLRWLSCIKQSGHVIVINIPSATLLLYEQGKVVLESRIIVGKRSTPTPTLSSKITEVILYPYWNVPYKIATRELLPVIKRYPGYLYENNYQILNMNGKVVDPADINWHALSPGYFPYVIRQSTGCDNALGLVKLNFYNPFSVYLHDTPGKFLFDTKKRYFSHGCMRLQKANEVAHYILRDNSIAIDTLEEKGCLNNKAPIVVPAREIIPVFVLYHTAWLDAEANVRFEDDIYNKVEAVKRKYNPAN